MKQTEQISVIIFESIFYEGIPSLLNLSKSFVLLSKIKFKSIVSNKGNSSLLNPALVFY